MNPPISILLITLLFISCNLNEKSYETEQEEVPVEEVKDVNPFNLKIDQGLLNNIQQKLNKECEQSLITIYDGEKETVLDQGVMFRSVPHDPAYDAFHEFSEAVRAEGNYLFLTNIDYDNEWNEFFDVFILPCDDQFQLIEMLGTNGINEEVTNEEIIAQMREWDELVGFELIYCDNSGIDCFMERLPEDIEAFAQETIDFCPFLINEEHESMEDYIAYLTQEKYFYLWYGVSFR
jgi:hypothetical protein